MRSGKGEIRNGGATRVLTTINTPKYLRTKNDVCDRRERK